MLYIPALKNKNGLIIISSGVHGVEGFTGSAVQHMMMEEFMTDENMASTGFLFIHGMNPYGFKNNRRVTENTRPQPQQLTYQRALITKIPDTPP